MEVLNQCSLLEKGFFREINYPLFAVIENVEPKVIYIIADFSQKDILKKHMTAMWEGTHHSWFILIEEKDKLLPCFQEILETTDVGEAVERRRVLHERLRMSAYLTGNTFPLKDEIRKRFNSFVYRKNIYVDQTLFVEAQSFVIDNTSSFSDEKKAAAKNGLDERLKEIREIVHEKYS